MIRDSSGNFAANVGTVNGLKLDNGSGSQVTLQTPVAFTSYSLKMPTTTGTTGYVLTTDGGTPAQLSWSSPAGLSFWQDGGSGKIYYSGGNVGIGTSNPTSDLQVTGTNPVVNLQGSSATINTMTAGGAVYGGLKFNATGNSELNLFQSVSPSAGNSLVISDNGNYPTYPSYGFNIPAGGTRNIAFRDLGNGMSVAEIRVTSNGANTASNMLINTVGHANPSLFLDSAGNVGIGTATPAQTLDVNGTASVSASIESAAAYTNSGTAYTIADTSSNIRRITLTGNATITLPAFATPANKVWTLTVIVTQDGTGSRTLGWAVPGGDSILWDQSASAPAPASGVTKTTIYQFTKPSDTTVWYGSMVWKQN